LSKKASTSDEAALLATIRGLNKEIAIHEQLRRQIPLFVLQPMVTEALGRVRDALAKNALPATAAPPFLETFKVGQEVTVTMSPEERARVLGLARDPATGEELRLLITESGQFVTAKLTELHDPPSSPYPSTSTTSSPGPLPLGPESTSSPSSTSSGIRPGDTVETSLGPAKVLRPHPGGVDQWEVQPAQGPPVYLPASELKVKVPGS